MSSLDGSMGVMLIGTFVALTLYGSAAQQTIRYYRLSGDDRASLKIFVGVIFALDTFHSVTLTHSCYHYLVSSYFNHAALDIIVWSLRIISLTTFGIIFLVQAFYVRRVYFLNKDYVIPVVGLGVLLLTELGLIFTNFALSLHIITFTGWGKVAALDSALFAAMMVTDIALTVTFAILLRRGRGGFKHTNLVLDTLMKYALVATLLVSFLAIPALVLSFVKSNLLIHVALVLPAAKIYTNSMLVFLNSRKSLARIMVRTGDTSIIHGMSALQRAHARSPAVELPNLQSGGRPIKGGHGIIEFTPFSSELDTDVEGSRASKTH